MAFSSSKQNYQINDIKKKLLYAAKLDYMTADAIGSGIPRETISKEIKVVANKLGFADDQINRSLKPLFEIKDDKSAYEHYLNSASYRSE